MSPLCRSRPDMKAVWPDSFPASMSSQSGADMLRVRVAVAAGPSRRTHRPSANLIRGFEQ